MDAVISYVNGCEKVWRTEYNKHGVICDSTYIRFYDWGTLRYVLRGISTYMPYIKNVFLLVSNIEQIPDYVDQDKVHIVLHKDFIPKEYLPTFNSCTIEIFLHNIKDLGDEFIYFNDDMIPISPIAYSDLIYNGFPCISFMENYAEDGKMSHYIIKNSFYAACLYVSYKDSYSKNIIENPLEYSGPGISSVHGPCVFLKHKNQEIYDELSEHLNMFITSERYVKNISQYIYSDVIYLEGSYVGSRLTLEYISSKDLKKDNCKNIISNTNANYICLNDLGQICGLTHKESAEIIQEALNSKLPNISKYELNNK